MRIAVIGGGPAGLYFAALARQLDPRLEITVRERNAPDDTFGFGVVFSAKTLRRIEQADPALFAELRRDFVLWDDIQVRHRGTTTTAGGNRFAALSRAGLLGSLQRHCAALGVPVHYGAEVADPDALAAEHDLVVAADGAHSVTRARFAEHFRPAVDLGRCRYLWLGTDRVLDSFVFAILDRPGGAAQVHAYPHSGSASTLILEMSERAWRRSGLGDQEPSLDGIAELCRDVVGGHKVVGRAHSRWLRFPTVRCERWRHRNVVLVGDAAHTAHFSIGSGTQLALEDAIALATSLRRHGGVPAALADYEAGRRPAVLTTQRAARASQRWFEHVDDYTGQHPAQFTVNLLTRSRKVSYASLRRRDPELLADVERWFAGGPGAPMLQPYRLGGLELVTRVVAAAPPVGPTRAGAPGDLHLVHLGSAALGGAGLVLSGPVAPVGIGTAVPGEATLATEEQVAGWRRTVGFVHAHTPAKVGVQLGHHGPAGSSWPAADLRRVFAAAAVRAADAGFDLLELDCARGLLAPPAVKTKQARPGQWQIALDVLDAVRAAWPADRPVTVRLAPPDRSRAGEAAVIEAADTLAAAGAAGVHLTGGPVYADRVRNRPGPPRPYAVLAAGGIAAADVDAVVLAGRADLCVLDPPAADPSWLSPRAAADRPVRKTPAYGGWRRDAS